MAFSDKLLNLVEGGDVDHALEAMTIDQCDVVGSQVFHFQPSEGLVHCATVRVDPELVAVMEAHYLDPENNPVVRDLHTIRLGHLEHLEKVTDYDLYQSSSVYADFSKPAGAAHSGIMLETGTHGLYMYALGTAGDWLSDDQTSQIAHEFKQVGRALDLRAALKTRELIASNVFLLDSGLRPILARQTQLQYLEAVDFRVDSNGRLMPDRVSLRARWHDTVIATLTGLSQKFCFQSSQGEIVAIKLDLGPVLAYGQTLICEIDRPSAPFWTVAMLSDVFQLTQREAEIALGLLAGKTLAQIADGMGIQTASVRVYSRRVFEKTGVHSQGRLIAFLQSRRLPSP